MHRYKAALAIVTVLTINVGVANAQSDSQPGMQTGPLYPNSMGVINQCYHGASQSDPCIRNPFKIAQLIRGQWTAVEPIRKWTIVFHPNSIFSPKNGTLLMSTIGSAKNGKYRIETAYPQDTAIYIDMDDGSHYTASIGLSRFSELLLWDENGTTTFHRGR